MLSCNTAYARIPGVQYTELKINGEVYDCPVGNKEREQKLYYIKSALAGDKIARDLLAGSGEFIFPIGDYTVTYLHMTLDKEWVEKF